ncbi:MAG: diguanylate cyclase [Pseudomonadota bacterium]
MNVSTCPYEQCQVQNQLQFFQTLIRDLPTVSYQFNETDNKADFISPNVTKAFGYSVNDIFNVKLWFNEKLHPDDTETAQADFSEWSESKRNEALVRRYRLRANDGCYLWVEDVMNRQAEHLSGTIRPIDNWFSAHKSMDALTQLVPAMLYQYEKGSDGNMHFPFVNNRVEDIFEVTAAQATRDPSAIFDNICSQDVEALFDSIEKSERSLSPWEHEFRTKTGNKWLRGLSIPERVSDNRTRWHGVIIDISEQKELEDKLIYLSSTDRMTGLFNRAHFKQLVDSEIQQLERYGTSLSLMIIDIDNFKQVNDVYGHPIGDLVIERLATIMKEQARRSDYCARLGGEEFAILLTNTEKNCAYKIGERLRAVINDEVFKADDVSFSITVTVGISQARYGDNWANLFSRTDERLYIGKQGGKNRTVCDD